ncbi:MAG TPA: hypothetical protein VLB27_00070, partial [candidate division Zixibacteria bacterium]|nr:hypothetical protein [candidate division Zixibacteria bacterium]
QSDDDELKVIYTDDYEFAARDGSLRLRMDLAGFEDTYDGKSLDRRVLTVGNLERHMVVTLDIDTLYSDIKPDPAAYEELWWYFYQQELPMEIAARRSWVDGDRFWSSHTIVASHGVEVNERHYDMFQIRGGHWFHVSVARPFYLEGDSTVMLAIASSLEVLPADSAGQ